MNRKTHRKVQFKTKIKILANSGLAYSGFQQPCPGLNRVTVNDLIKAHSQINAPYLTDAPLEFVLDAPL